MVRTLAFQAGNRGFESPWGHMAHHKRKKPKNARSGCLMCKYWKVNGAKKETQLKASERRKIQKDNGE